MVLKLFKYLLSMLLYIYIFLHLLYYFREYYYYYCSVTGKSWMTRCGAPL